MRKIWHSVVVAAIVAVCGQGDMRVLAELTRDALPTTPIKTPVKTQQRSTTSQSRKSICANMAFRNNAGILHQGKLMLNNSGNGAMQVNFFNANTNRSEAIVQAMTVRDSEYGILIVGSNPVYAGTRNRHPTYHPDNFLIKVQENGEYLFFAFDGQGTQSAVDISDCRY
jgi:hypothetical protein